LTTRPWPHSLTRVLAARLLFEVLAVLALAAGMVGCGESPGAHREREDVARKERAQKERDRRKAIVSALATSHNADVGWSEGDDAWTAEVQDRLMRSDKRPVAGVASLNDIERDGNSYFVKLDYGDVFGPVIRFVLKCPHPEPTQKPSLLLGEQYTTLLGPHYAFVARINRVRRSDLIDSDEGKLHTRRRWIAEGECLAGLQPMPLDEAKATGGPARRRSGVR
jgi:hypothetical protein